MEMLPPPLRSEDEGANEGGGGFEFVMNEGEEEPPKCWCC